MNWIGHINRMVVKEKKVKYLTKKKILWDVDYEDDRKTDSGTVYKQIVITAKLQIGKSGQKKKSWLGEVH